MAKTKFFKEATLPATPEADAFYFIENGNYAESYITDSAGVPKMIGNSVMINELIASAISSANSILFAADIAARDALTLTSNTIVWVGDATTDPTVDSGGANYFYDSGTTTFIKIGETESMDVVVAWGDVAGRPTSSPAAIDLAVTNSHTHANKALLDRLGEDVDNCLTLDGNQVQGWQTTNW